MSMELSIKDENTILGNKTKRSPNPDKLKRDSRRWQRKRATIGKYMQEKFGLPAAGRGIELDIHNPKR
jgi:hypothetical protein